MVRVADKGDLYVHQGERSERERAAIGKASREACVRPATCPQEVSTTRTTGGANWNVIGLILDTTHSASRRCRFAARRLCLLRRVKDSLVERHTYTPYGELTVDQETSFGDRDADGNVDSTDKGTPGTDCTGTVSGACRILDLDPALDTSPRAEHAVAWRQPRVAGRDESRVHGDYDSTDATKFDSLPQGLAAHPGRTATSVDQPFAHQGLLFEPEIGSYQNRTRQYLPSTRRFLQRDSIGYVDGLNLYGRVGGDPLGNQDPSGAVYLIPEAEDIADSALDYGVAIAVEIITSIPIGTVYGPAFSHCLSHCIITRITSVEVSRQIGPHTERIQRRICRLMGNCGLGGLVRSTCNSADQQSDYWDNQLGRSVATTSSSSCYSGCKTRMGNTTTHPEGNEEGSNREFGPLGDPPGLMGDPNILMPDGWGP